MRTAMLWAALALAGAWLGACASAPAPPGPRPPAEVRLGRTDMAITRVEREVAREEVLAAVQRLVDGAETCMSWPSLWLDADARRTRFVARFDLMARDWGEEVAASNRARMQEFVTMGLLEARERPDIGAGAVEYMLTAAGAAALRGAPHVGATPPSFCGRSERRVAEITAMEWGDFACGTLRVRFTHIADQWPSWARSERSQALAQDAWGPPGVARSGAVSLGRIWRRRDALPAGEANGQLNSLCYDQSQRRIVGDDLDLNADNAAY